MSDPVLHPYPWLASCYSKIIAAYQAKRLPHALLFSGPRGIGKLALAKTLAQTLLCTQAISEQDYLLPCGQCQSCHWFNLGHHADFQLVMPLEQSSVIKIDQVRELTELLQQTSQRSGYKIIIIHLAEQLNQASANAILKSLEEPQANCLFILLSEQPSLLLPTLLSRCQQFHLTSPEFNQADQYLAQQLSKSTNAANIGEQRRCLALLLAANAPLAALEILTQEQDQVFKQFCQDLSAYFAQHKSLITISEQWHKHELTQLVNYLQLFLVELTRLLVSSNTTTTTNTNKTHHHLVNIFWSACLCSTEDLAVIQVNYTSDQLDSIYQQAIKIKRALSDKISVNNQLALEQILLASALTEHDRLRLTSIIN